MHNAYKLNFIKTTYIISTMSVHNSVTETIYIAKYKYYETAGHEK